MKILSTLLLRSRSFLEVNRNMRNVYFHEFNITMEDSVYLPVSSGCLQSYALQNDLIRSHYRFLPIRFIKRESFDSQDPEIAAFSCSMWNIRYNLSVAKRLKEQFPHCLIVFGGCSVPFDSESFMDCNQFIDVCIRGEGEYAFSQVLQRNTSSRCFEGIPSVSWREKSSVVENKEEVAPDLDYPCPYVSGVFDELMLDRTYKYQVIIETNRGCPFGCAYCFWGQGTLKYGKKFRFFSMSRVVAFSEWCGRNRIEYVFCADSNFGTFQRDLDIAKCFVDSKIKWGYPDKFRVCYAKNSEDRVFEIGRLLHKHKMEKSITLSLQSCNEQVLRNIGRSNIKMSVFSSLSTRYAEEEIPVYTEFILGLPGETFESFISGIFSVLQSSFSNQIFIYFCQVLPNTKLNSQDFREKHSIKTVEIPLTPIHGSTSDSIDSIDREEIVISTETLSVLDWKECSVFSWMLQLLHSLKIGYLVLLYLKESCEVDLCRYIQFLCKNEDDTHFGNVCKFFRSIADSVVLGHSYSCVVENAVPVFWSVEEAAYLNLARNSKEFFAQLRDMTKEFLQISNVDFSVSELNLVFSEQERRVPSLSNGFDSMYNLSKNLLYNRKGGSILYDSRNTYRI